MAGVGYHNFKYIRSRQVVLNIGRALFCVARIRVFLPDKIMLYPQMFGHAQSLKFRDCWVLPK